MGLVIDDNGKAIQIRDWASIQCIGQAGIIAMYSHYGVEIGARRSGGNIDESCPHLILTTSPYDQVHLAFDPYLYLHIDSGGFMLHDGDNATIESTYSNGCCLTLSGNSGSTQILLFSSHIEMHPWDELNIYGITFAKTDWQKLKKYCQEH